MCEEVHFCEKVHFSKVAGLLAYGQQVSQMNSFTGIFQGFYLDFTPFYFEEPLCSQQLVENPDEYQKLPRIWWFRVSCLFKLAVQS